MNFKALKLKLLSNNFDIILLNQQEFNKTEFDNLCKTLKQMSVFLKDTNSIDKEIALKLYLCQNSINSTINEIITNNKIEDDILNTLDNANIILNEIIIDILSIIQKVC